MAEMTLPAGLADEIEALLYRSRRAALFEAWAAAREAEGALPLLSRFRRYRLRSPADPAARATELRQLAAAAMAQDEAAPLRTWLSRVRDWPGLYALGAALQGSPQAPRSAAGLLLQAQRARDATDSEDLLVACRPQVTVLPRPLGLAAALHRRGLERTALALGWDAVRTRPADAVAAEAGAVLRARWPAGLFLVRWAEWLASPCDPVRQRRLGLATRASRTALGEGWIDALGQPALTTLFQTLPRATEEEFTALVRWAVQLRWPEALCRVRLVEFLRAPEDGQARRRLGQAWRQVRDGLGDAAGPTLWQWAAPSLEEPHATKTAIALLQWMVGGGLVCLPDMSKLPAAVWPLFKTLAAVEAAGADGSIWARQPVLADLSQPVTLAATLHQLGLERAALVIGWDAVRTRTTEALAAETDAVIRARWPAGLFLVRWAEWLSSPCDPVRQRRLGLATRASRAALGEGWVQSLGQPAMTDLIQAQARAAESQRQALAQWVVRLRWPAALCMLRLAEFLTTPDDQPARRRLSLALRSARSELGEGWGDTLWQWALPLLDTPQAAASATELLKWLADNGNARWPAPAQLPAALAQAWPVLLRLLVQALRDHDPARADELLRRLLALCADDPARQTQLGQTLRLLGAWGALNRVRIAQWQADRSRRELLAVHLGVLEKSAPRADQLDFARQLGEQVPDNDAEADGLCRIIDAAGDADLLAQAVRRNTERLGPLWGRLAQLRFAGPPGSRPSADQRAALIGAVRELLPQGAPDQPGEGLTAADWRALRQGGSAWLATASLKALPVPAPADEPLIEALADATHRQGLFTVWSGYTAQDIKSEDRLRRPNDIRVARRSGRLLHALVRARQARRVLEIGSGFGVSGMYLNAALARLPQGRLKTFEANADWQPIAAANIAVTGPLPESVAGPFTPTSLAADERFDLVFIDAIHTPAAVQEQLDAVHPHLDPGALVVVDDVRFSPEMLDHWRGEAKSARWAASFELFGRFGILEVA